MGTKQMDSPGIICAGEIYTRDEFLSRVRWSLHAFRAARRAGLVVKYAAGRCYVAGESFHQYLSEHGKATKA